MLEGLVSRFPAPDDPLPDWLNMRRAHRETTITGRRAPTVARRLEPASR